jgi:sec-independent protein translocase protein TatB
MFDIAPTELMLCAVIALVVIGPKDLPKAMRFVGKYVGKARGMAKHFRTGLDTMMREAELEEMEKQWRSHNEAIMRAYPQITPGALDPGAVSGPGGPLDTNVARSEPRPVASPAPDPAEAALPPAGEVKPQ